METNGFWMWRNYEIHTTGRWALMLKYDRGPATMAKTDYIFFSTEKEARDWFTNLMNSVFIVRANHPTPPPPPPKGKERKVTKITRKSTHLRLV